MNKFLITALLVSVLGTAAFAQKKGDVEVGIGVGLNAATVTSGNLTNTDYRTGINAGLSLEYYFSPSWSFKVKGLYDQKGWNSGYLAVGNNSYTTNYKLNYVTVPLLANWHFGRTKQWYLNFGPYVSFLASASESATNTDVKSYFNSVDAGLDLGIGIKFPVAQKTKFFVEFSGQGGIADIGTGNSGSTVRNSVSAFNIGLTF